MPHDSAAEQRLSALYASAVTNIGIVCPDTIRTDHGGAFIHTQSSACPHPFDALCAQLHTARKVWRPKTLWHNGKAERSRRDQERCLRFIPITAFQSG